MSYKINWLIKKSKNSSFNSSWTRRLRRISSLGRGMRHVLVKITKVQSRMVRRMMEEGHNFTIDIKKKMISIETKRMQTEGCATDGGIFSKESLAEN
jgi:hypothetical protein